jgi:hypothetical protein
MSWATVKVCPIPFPRRHALDANVVLAIDLGRYNSVACWYDPDIRAAEFRTVHTTPKSDRDDGLKLARLEAVGEVDPVVIPDRKTRQWKSLIGLRKRLVSERVRTQNRIRGVLVGQGLMSPRGFSAWTTAGVNGLATLS